MYIVKYKCELSVGVHSEVYKCELSVGVHSEVYKCELSVGVHSAVQVWVEQDACLLVSEIRVN